MSSTVLLQTTPLHVHLLVTRFFSELGSFCQALSAYAYCTCGTISLQLYITCTGTCIYVRKKPSINNPEVTKDCSLMDKIIKANSIRIRGLEKIISTTINELQNAKVGTSVNLSTNHLLQMKGTCNWE